MHIEIDYKGKTYVSKEMEEVTMQEAVDAVWENFSELSKFRMELVEGGLLLLGRDAIQSCAFRICP
jgi:hypothetical protein